MWDKLVFVSLSAMGIEDLKKRTVSLWKIYIFSGIVILALLDSGVSQFADMENLSGLSMAVGALPGLLLLWMGRMSGGAIGTADGIVVLGLGIYMGIWKIMSILSIAFLGTLGVSGILLIVLNKSKNYEIPFIPFLVAGMAGSMLWGRL